MKKLAIFDQQDRFLSFASGELSDHEPIAISDTGQPCVVEVPPEPPFNPPKEDIVFTRAGWQIIPGLSSARTLTPLTVLSRLTPAEEAAFQASTDLAVSVVRGRFTAAQEIRTDDPRTVEGINVLVAKGIITQARVAEVFA